MLSVQFGPVQYAVAFFKVLREREGTFSKVPSSFFILFLFILLRADAGEEFFFFAVCDGEAVEPDALNVLGPGKEGFVHVEDLLFDVVSAQAEQELSVLGALEAGYFFAGAVGDDALRLHGAFAEGAEGEADAGVGAELLEIDDSAHLFEG